MSEISPEFNLAVTRFCDYLSTLPFDTAMQIWGMMPRNSQLGEFAATILAGLPADFFNQTPSIEQRFVYKNGTVAMEAIVNADEQTPWPTPVEAASGLPAQAKIPTPTQRSMNSFMVFRSFMAPAFKNIPQKAKSIAISNLWQVETEKAHWELMARAYTYLRNNYELQDTRLADFVKSVAPKFGLPEPEDYVKALGHQLVECDLSICMMNNPRSAHYHLTNYPMAPITLQIEPLTMDEMLKPFIDNPGNMRKLNSGPVENVMNVARGTTTTTTAFDSITNPASPDDLEDKWSFSDIYGEEDDSFVGTAFTGDPLTDPIYTRMLQQQALLMQSRAPPNFVYVPSNIPFQTFVLPSRP